MAREPRDKDRMQGHHGEKKAKREHARQLEFINSHQKYMTFTELLKSCKNPTEMHMLLEIIPKVIEVVVRAPT